GLAELRVLHGDADGASHCRLATAAQCKAVDCRDHRLAEILDEIEHFLANAAGPLGVDRTRMRGLADVGAVDECLVPRAPVRMTPRTAASSRASSKAVRKSFQVGVLSALSTFGRLSVT